MTDKLRVSVSYARRDASDFAEYLVVALKFAGFDAFLDRHDIAKAEDWEARIGDLIAKSDTVVFVLTPESVQSERCDWEVKRAVALGKRIVPVQWIAVPEADVPEELKRLNYTIFSSGQPFNGPLAELTVTLGQDLGWLRQQTELGEAAERWQASNRNDDLLLRGVPITKARKWANDRKPNAPQISPLLTAFIGASEEGEVARSNAERQHLAEIAAAQLQRGEALAAAEASRHWRRVVIGMSFLVVSGFAVVSAWQWRQAVKSEQRATRTTAVLDIIEALSNSPSRITIDAIGGMKTLVQTELSQKTIVWFDPLPSNNLLVEAAFKKMGFKVERATTLTHAQDLLRTKHDVIISHYGAPEKGAVDTTPNAYRLINWQREAGVERRPIIIYSIGVTKAMACSAQNDKFFDETDDASYLFSAVLLAMQGQKRPDRC